MHDAPCYSQDGKKLYFLAGNIGASGKTEKEKFHFVERDESGWGKPKPLSPVFDSFNLHWQFSLDQENGVFFGGVKEGSTEKGDIWYSKYDNGQYFEPEKLEVTVNTDHGEFPPCIAPDGSYLIFNRALFLPQERPKFLLYVSFRSAGDSWTEAECLSDLLSTKGHDLNAKISPDGQYLFFISIRDNVINRAFWVDAKIIQELKPDELKK